jgi:hypothetical protein
MQTKFRMAIKTKNVMDTDVPINPPISEKSSILLATALAVAATMIDVMKTTVE